MSAVAASESAWQAEANRLRLENDKLRKALKKYAECRHASIDCVCVIEARAALYQPKVKP